MNSLSKDAKNEIYNALEGEESGIFVMNGKLISIEIENFESSKGNDSEMDLVQEIEEYPELKESLVRYQNNPDMKRYTGSQLKAKRSEKRK